MFLVLSISENEVVRTRHDSLKEAQSQAKENVESKKYTNVRITIVIQQWLSGWEVNPLTNETY